MQWLNSDGTIDWSELIDVIKTLRGLTDQELADKLHVKTADIASWTYGDVEPEEHQREAIFALAPKPHVDPGLFGA